MSEKIYVLYHAHCTDGTGSKFAAWSKFKESAEYIPVQYSKPVPDMEPRSRVYIIDFSYPKNVLEQLISVHKEVVVLDHHKTAQADLEGVPGCTFDMHRSGCVMAWNYFHPGVEVPDLLLDIQDRDLWLFKRPNSKITHAGLKLLEDKMSEWNHCVTCEEDYDYLVDAGKTLLKAQDLTVASYVKNKIKVIKFLGYKVGITNTTELISEIGDAICLDSKLAVDFAFMYCITAKNEVLCSLRSAGNMDVSNIAKRYGGGGHKNAAGFGTEIASLIDILSERMR